MLLGCVDATHVRIGEPPVDDASFRSAESGEVTGEGDAEFGLAQGLAEFGDDLGRSVVQAIEDAQQARADVLARVPSRRWLVFCEPEQVVALIEGEGSGSDRAADSWGRCVAT